MRRQACRRPAARRRNPRRDPAADEGRDEVSKLRTREIPIKPSRTYLHREERTDFGQLAWTRSPPFVVNPRGVLIHRVQHVTTYLREFVESHIHASYLCGNGCNFDPEDVADVLVFDPPTDRLLCEFCEAKAKRKQLPSGDELAGRHVHRGVLVPMQTCCKPPN